MSVPLSVVALGGGVAWLAATRGDAVDADAQNVAGATAATNAQLAAAHKAAAAAGGTANATTTLSGTTIHSQLAHAAIIKPPPPKTGLIKVGIATSRPPAMPSINITSGGKGASSPNLTSGGTIGAATDAAKVALQAKLDQAVNAAKTEYDKLSHAAKCAAVDAIKKKWASNPALQKLDCDTDTFQNILIVTGSALAASGAAAGCAAVSFGTLGPVCGALGAMLGAWVTAKIAPWCEEQLNALGNWAEGVWDDVEDAASAVYDEVTSPSDWF